MHLLTFEMMVKEEDNCN